jgi:hypothetical protein
MVSTKIDVNYNRVARTETLDEMARLLFPGSRNHRKIFLAVFVELKWAEGQFLPALEPIADKHGLSHRSLETVRAKMRRMGIIDHVSRFSKRHGCREGWVFSNRFPNALNQMADLTKRLREPKDPSQEQKDRDCLFYV